MPRPWRLRFEGAKYHVTQRGNGGQAVFLGRRDSERFLHQLDHCLKKAGVELHAYCLMPNHCHLFIETPLGNIQRFMQTLNTAYGMYFRYKHSRPGHCWQGRYGAKLVRDDHYVLALTRYIHLNPVKIRGWKDRPLADKIRRLEGWEWSSYPGYVGLRPAEDRVNYRSLELMEQATANGCRKAYRAYVQKMLGMDDEEFLRDSSASGYAIGDEEYREEVAEALKDKRAESADTGDVAWPEDKRPGIEEIERVVLKEFGVSRDDLHMHGRKAGVAKSVAIEMCCRLSGATQREVARYFGYNSDSGVSLLRRRLAAMLVADRTLSATMATLQRSASECIV